MEQVAPHRRPKRDRTAFAFLIHLKLLSRKGCLVQAARDAPKEASMLDIILLAIGLGFFVLSVGYTIACDRL
jgi:hypothetical protein